METVLGIDLSKARAFLRRKVGRDAVEDVLQDAMVNVLTGRYHGYMALRDSAKTHNDRQRYRSMPGLPDHEHHGYYDIGPAVIDHEDAYGPQTGIREMLSD